MILADFWIDVAPWICVALMVLLPLLFLAALIRAVYEVERDRRDEQPVEQRRYVALAPADAAPAPVVSIELARARRRRDARCGGAA